MTASVLLAGGGSGGHVYPSIAVALALRDILPELRAVFVGTERGLEKDIVPRAGFPLELLPLEPVRGGGLATASRGLLSLARTLPRARSLIARHAPGVVLSLGGYAATPVALAARAQGVPLAIMSPDSVPGLSNRLVAPLAQRVYTAFEEAESSFSRGTVLRTGVAIRRDFVPQPFTWGQPGQERRLSVLVLGGSQGARALNELIPGALGRTGVTMNVVHQVGRGNGEAVQRLYSYFGVQLEFSVREFIDDMAQALARADLVISRAGAGAIAEICAVGRPSILLPLASAAGNHQLKNARALERAGAALCVPMADASTESLSTLVNRLRSQPERLREMAAQAQAWGRPDAADVVARDLLRLGGLLPGQRSYAPERASGRFSPPEGAG
jgi:UDP-N-acetylglucosamine--N-acetylmuramyl-(pentapeptide) pyrophosphoryl-undecaprenol N-acetylglucosamine transferase